MDKTIGRRSFLKLAALGATSVSAFGNNETLRDASADEVKKQSHR